MKTSNVFLLVVFVFFVHVVSCGAALYFTEIGPSYLNYATAYNNGFKIVPVQTYPEDTLFAVYSYSVDTLYFAVSYDRGESWEANSFTATQWGNGHYPSIDVHNSLPYVVSEGDSGGQGDIFLKCPLDWSIPQRICNTPGHSTYPAIVIDDSFYTHIVWQDESDGDWEIYYCCAQYDTGVSEIINLSDNVDVRDTYPTIGIYNGDEIHVVWERYDSECYSPYSIVHRYLSGGNWSNEDTLAGSIYIPQHHPSLDFCHGEWEISGAWEDSTAGNLDIFFYQGIVGPHPTSGQSRFPVVSAIATVCAYGYWEDNSDGYDDIYGVNLYNPGGKRYMYKFRDEYGDEDMHHPNVTNCYVIWTQGNLPPYKVMFACEGYPIGINEEEKGKTSLPELQVTPNPFTQRIDIMYSGYSEKQKGDLEIFDISGRLIDSVPLTTDH